MADATRATYAQSPATRKGPLPRWHQGLTQALTRTRRGRLNLALQGGGSHGAFTWGVLDRLLEDERLEFEGVSGASAGAMNAVVFASGLLNGGRQGAQAALHDFWRGVGGAARLGPLQPTPVDYLVNGWNRDWSPGYLLLSTLSKLASPYQTNPAGFNPLIGLLERHVDFEGLRTRSPLKLFISLTNVHTGLLRLARNPDFSARVLAASACLPLVFQAVEIDGEHYWDGGFSANPPLTPLLFDCAARDVLLIQLSPVRHGTVPKTIGDIIERSNEFSFNSGFLRELQLLTMLKRQRWGWLGLNARSRALQGLRLHQIHTDGALGAFGKKSRINAEWTFLKHLRDLGRQHADDWLRNHRQALGRRPTLALDQFLT
jgi:NTE family protein